MFRRLSLMFSALCVCVPGFAQLTPPFTCTVALNAPTTVRQEGVTELLNDIVITCTGGVPTPSGLPVATNNFQLFLNTNATNQQDQDPNVFDYSDALLIIDEPHSVANPNRPLLACSGSCTILGAGTNTYDGSPGHPNVFPGYVVQGLQNSVAWLTVPIDPPGRTGVRTLRITNLRANASLPLTSGNQITVNFFVNGSQQTVLENPTQAVSFVQPSLRSTFGSVANLSLCSPANPSIAGDPTKPLDSGGQNGSQFSVTLSEGFANAFRPKNTAQVIANAPSSGVFPAPIYPVDVNENIPGFVYSTETSFFNNGLDPVPAVTNPAIPFTPNFPAVNQLDLAGVADQGTRLYLQVTSVPTGMQFYVPVQVPLLSTDASNLNQQTGTAVLVSTDSTGAGSYAPIAGNANGLAPMQTNGTTAMAVYEVIYSDPSHMEAVTIPIAAAYGSDVLSTLAPGALNITAGYSPISSTPVSGDSTVPVPRFSSRGASQVGFSVGSCAPHFAVSLSHSGNLTQGGSGMLSLVATNVGGVASSSTVTIADSLPAGLTATEIPGTGWSCSFFNLTCSRSDPIASGASFPPLYISVNVAANAPASVINTASVLSVGETNIAYDTIQLTPLQPVTVGTNIPGLAFTVDGFGYTSTQTFQWAIGSTHSVEADAIQIFAGTQFVYNNWSDSQGQSHLITVGATAATFTATYLTLATGAILCRASDLNPPIVRTEGRTELAGDIYLSCTGGTPTAAGMQVPKIDFHLRLNSNLTSRQVFAGYSEALMFVDEPHSGGIGTTQTLLACGASGSNDDGTGVCAITSTGSPPSTYNASTGHPNVFQAQLGAANELVWKGVPFDPPGSGTRILRITNVRGDATTLPLNLTINIPLLQGTLTALPGGLAIDVPQLTVGYSEAGLITPVATSVLLSQCAATNPSIATDPSRPLDIGGQNGAQFSITLTEGFASVFQVKNFAQVLANTAFTTIYPNDVNQNIPGYVYNTATGFFNGASDPIDPIAPFNFIGPTPQFPLIRGFNQVGEADNGTRIYVRFSPIPSGMQLFVPTKVALTGAAFDGTIIQTGVAVLTSTDALGGGSYTPIIGNAAGLAPVAIVSGTGTAVYEVLESMPNVTESVTIPVAAAYDAPLTSLGTIHVEYGLAPLSTVGTGDLSSPIPRYAELNMTTPAFTFQSCSYVEPLTLTYSIADNGKQDVSVYYPGQGGYQYSLLSTGTGTYAGVANSGIGAFDTVLQGDFNGDSKSDMLFYNSATGALKVGLGGGTGTFVYSAPVNLTPGYTVLARGDFNRDGKTDLLLYRNSDGAAAVALSNGDGTFRYIGQTFSPGFTSVAVADYDGDGISDVILYNNLTPPYVAYYLKGDGAGHFVNGASLFFGPGYSVYPADLNRDGKSDFILYRPSDGTVFVAIGNGTSFTYHYLLYSPGFTAFKIGDVNGDGIPDLVLYNSQNANGYLLLGDGVGNFPSGSSLFFGPGMDFVDLRDFDADGRQDVLLYRSTDGTSFTGISSGLGFAYTNNYFGPGRIIAQ